MEKRLKEYLAKMERFCVNSLAEEERREIMEDLLLQIGFFQHERLIHLIVTVTFALLLMLAVLASLFLPQLPLFLLILLLLVLLIPYIRHYYILENGVQRLYQYYDVLRETGKSVGEQEG